MTPLLNNSKSRGQECVKITRTRRGHRVFLHIKRTKTVKEKKITSLEIDFALRSSSVNNKIVHVRYITYFTCSRISRYWELFFQNRSRELFLQ